jgi:hypothetical protein
VVVAQFTFCIELLLQSGAVGSIGLSRRPFLLVVEENNFGDDSLHLVTKYIELREDLIQVSICSNQGPSEVLTEEEWAEKGIY